MSKLLTHKIRPVKHDLNHSKNLSKVKPIDLGIEMVEVSGEYSPMKVTTEENVIIQIALMNYQTELRSCLTIELEKVNPRAYKRFKIKLKVIEHLIQRLKIS